MSKPTWKAFPETKPYDGATCKIKVATSFHGEFDGEHVTINATWTNNCFISTDKKEHLYSSVFSYKTLTTSGMKHFKLEFKAGRDWEGDWTSFWGLHKLLGYTWSEWNQTIGFDLRKVWVDGVEIDKFKWHHH